MSAPVRVRCPAVTLVSVHHVAEQPPLALALPAHQSLESFVTGCEPNAVALAAVERLIRFESIDQAPDRLVLLWGGSGSGKSHLVNGAARAAQRGDRRVAVVDLAGGEPVRPQWLEALHAFDLVAIEGLHRIAGDAAWEDTLFAFLDRALLGEGTRVITTSRMLPDQLGLTLKDLVNRLQWGLVLPVHATPEEAFPRVLRQRAEALGLELEPAVIDYLLRREPRELAYLLRLLDELDTASLAARRKVTLPFVQQYLRGRSPTMLR